METEDKQKKESTVEDKEMKDIGKKADHGPGKEEGEMEEEEEKW